MKWIRVSGFTFSALLLTAGAVLASASGVAAVDQVVNTGVRIAQGGGLGLLAYGALGCFNHIRGADWMGATGHLGVSMLGGGVAMNAPTVSTAIGGVAAALVHPATHAVLHAAVRVVS